MSQDNKLVIAKFGGTSMGDAACMLRSAQIVITRHAKLVVVSATSGTTNQLIELGKIAQQKTWEEVENLINKILNRHTQIALELAQTPDTLNDLFAELKSLAKGIFLLKDCSPRAMDTLLSLGERMSSKLFSSALEKTLQKQAEASGQSCTVRLLDIRNYLLTDYQFGQAKPQLQMIFEKFSSLRESIRGENIVYVAQGFIGGTPEGQTTTLGRGGSDYSAALIAEALQADILEIWTDVAGIATTDPRIVQGARPIEEISFKEASELAVFGAKVLHPATLLPAMRKNIPTFVGSSFQPELKGTWIKKEVQQHPLVRAMAIRRQQALVTISTPEMLNTYGFLLQIFKIFNDHQVSIDSITTSEISIAVTLDESILQNKSLFQELEQIAEISVEQNLCLVSMIGNNMNHTPGLSKKIFESISEVNVRMICLGASKHNFCFLVSDEQGSGVLQKLHRSFLEN